MILELLWFLFVFCLGGVCCVAAAGGGAWYFLVTLEKKSEEKKKALLAQKDVASDSQRAVSVLMPELKSRARLTLGEQKPKAELKTMPWLTIVLKSNMLFRFEETETTTGSIGRLDGCTIRVHQYGTKARWSPRSSIEITTPDGRDLFPDIAGQSTCFLYFPLGREAEQWFHALRRATGLTEIKDAAAIEKLQLEHRYFNHLSANVPHSGDVNADWFNAILGRVFWGIHDKQPFLNFVKSKLAKKIAKLKMPSVVESIKLAEVSFGPNLPLFSNIRLNSFTPLGAMNADGDVHYHGGFFFKLAIQLKIKVPVTKNYLCVPVKVGVTIKTVSGRMNFQCAPPPAGRGWIAFYGEPNVDVDISTEIGTFSNFKLANIPHLMNIIINKTKAQLIKKMVVPVMDDYPIPKIPKKYARKAAQAQPEEGNTEPVGISLRSSAPSTVKREEDSQPKKSEDKEQSKEKPKDKEKEKDNASKEKEQDKVPPVPQRNHAVISSSGVSVSSPSSHLTHRKIYQPHSAAIPPAVPRRTHVPEKVVEKRPRVQEMKDFSKPKEKPAKSLPSTPAKQTPTPTTTPTPSPSKPPTPSVPTPKEPAVTPSVFGISPPHSASTSPPSDGKTPLHSDSSPETTPRLSTSPSEPPVASPLRASVPGLFSEPPDTFSLPDNRPKLDKRDNAVVNFSTPSLFEGLDLKGKGGKDSHQGEVRDKEAEEKKAKETSKAADTESEPAGIRKVLEGGDVSTKGNKENGNEADMQELTHDAEANPKGVAEPGEAPKNDSGGQERPGTAGDTDTKGDKDSHEPTAPIPPEGNEKEDKQPTKTEEEPKSPEVARPHSSPTVSARDAHPLLDKQSLFPDPLSLLFSSNGKGKSLTKQIIPDPLLAMQGTGGLFQEDTPASDQSSPPPLPNRPGSMAVPPLPARTHPHQSPQQPPHSGGSFNPPPLPARPASQPAPSISPFPATVITPLPTPIPSPSVLDNPLAQPAEGGEDEDEEEFKRKELLREERRKQEERERNKGSGSLDAIKKKEKYRTTSPLLTDDNGLLNFEQQQQQQQQQPPSNRRPSQSDPFASLPFLSSTPTSEERGNTTQSKNLNTSNGNNKNSPAGKKTGVSPPSGGPSVFNKDFFGTIFNNMEGKVDFLKERVAEGDWTFLKTDKKAQRDSKHL